MEGNQSQSKFLPEESMLTPNRELMQQAREALKGKWGLAISGSLIYLGITVIAQFIPIIKFVANLIITGPLLLGMTAFYLTLSRRQEANLSQLFDGFQRFVDALVTYLLMALFIFLWSLLLIVPGIMAALSYALTFFLMVENPGLKGKEALQKSKALMNGHRGKLFYLFLRFLGWIILGAMTFGIAFLWIIPYMQTAMARFYDDVRANSSANGQNIPKPVPVPPPASQKPTEPLKKPQPSGAAGPAPPSAPVSPLKQPIHARARVCLRCHESIPDPEAQFCPACGFRLDNLEASGSPKVVAHIPKSAAPVGPPAPPPIQPLRPGAKDMEVTMMVGGPRLVSFSKDGKKETYDLRLPLLKLGRAKDNDLTFPEEMAISGHHCEIYRDGKNFYIRDLGSTNGVLVNKLKVESAPLNEGDEIMLGDKVFTFTRLG
jgi:uncharacterized membrane protein